jgi:hypothetical protein
MFDHTLRMDDSIPAKRATLHYFDQTPKGFQGRPRQTLPLAINQDLKRAASQSIQHPVHALDLPRQLKSIEDLRKLESLARVRLEWNTVVMCVTNTQVPEPRKPTPTSRCLDRAGTKSDNNNNNNQTPIQSETMFLFNFLLLIAL